MAAGIGKEISATTIKLGKLAQRESGLRYYVLRDFSFWTVAKRKTLFDDRPVEISVGERYHVYPHRH